MFFSTPHDHCPLRPVDRARRFTGFALFAVLIASIAAGYKVSPLQADDASAPSLEMPIDDVWQVILFEGKPAGSVHQVQRAVWREGAVILVNETTTRVQTERFGMPAEIVFLESSEETVTGERLRITARMDVPGAPSRIVTAKIEGNQLLVSTVEGDQSHEFALDWTPALAAGMRLQSRFELLPWSEGDTLSAETYNVLYGLMSTTFTCLGESEVTLADGTTRTLTQLERVSEMADGSKQTIRYFLVPGEGILVEQIDGGATMERVADESAAAGLLASAAPADAAQGELIDEYWSMALIGGNRVGRMQSTTRRIERDGNPVLVKEEVFTLTMTRFGEEQEMVFSNLQERTPDGQFLRSTELSEMPGEPATTFEAVLVGEELVVTTTAGDQVSEERFPWTAELAQGMQFAANMETYAWQPGEEVVTTQYGFGGVGETTYFNRGEEVQTLYDGSTRTLLHIEQVGGEEAAVTHYYLEQGVGMVVMHVQNADMRVERVPREIATDVNAVVEETGTVIRVSFADALSPASLYQAASIGYRLKLSGLQAAVVANDLRQTVTQIDADTIEVNVTSNPVSTDLTLEGELDACLNSGDYVDLNDELLQSLASEGVAGAVSTLDKALALELFVGEYVANDYEHLFDSASQVALSKAGDCSEHSVLLVALLRANGIPARGAAGLVVDVANQKAFGHMWAEAYIDGAWRPLDAIRSAGGITPTYIKFADWNLLENEAASAQFIQAVGIWQSPLEIEVLGGADAE